MKKLLTIQPWKLFLFLTSPIFLSVFISENNFEIYKFNNFDLSLFFKILGIIFYFSWIILLGLRLHNSIRAHYKFNKLLFVFAILFCLIDFSLLSISSIFYEKYQFLNTISFLLTPFTFWGLIYMLYAISKIFKSVELQRDVRFTECLREFFLFFCFPIGVWFIQPKINKLFSI